MFELESLNPSLASEIATKALSIALPSLSFRSYEEVLEARYLCRDTLSGYRNYVAQLARKLEIKADLKEEAPQLLLNKISEELTDLKNQVSETKRAFLRDALKRASPILTTLGVQLYLNSTLAAIIGAAFGTAAATMISAYEAHMSRKKLLFGERSHGLSFMLRLQGML